MTTPGSGVPDAALPGVPRCSQVGRSMGSQLWQREYWDRYIRDERHFQSARVYIENNPVSAGLAKIPTGWPWSSAGYGIREVTS